MSATPDDLKPTIDSVARALRFVARLAETDVLSVSSTAAELGVARSTAHRLLSTLVSEGFARQLVGSRKYTRGDRLMRLMTPGFDELAVRAAVRPHLEALRRELDETVSLARLDGARIVFVDALEPSSALRVASRMGYALPAHATAAGKAMLAELSPAERTARLGHGPLARLTARTCVDVAKLERELGDVATRGYSVSVDESEDGVAAVAVAIRWSGGHPMAIGVSMPSARMTATHVETIAGTLRAHAAGLETQAP